MWLEGMLGAMLNNFLYKLRGFLTILILLSLLSIEPELLVGTSSLFPDD